MLKSIAIEKRPIKNLSLADRSNVDISIKGNLITVDMVCRSIPSGKLWRNYLDWQEKRYNSKAKAVSFRKKTYGYHSGA